MDESQQEREYAKRFNQGYMLAKYKPELYAQLTKGNEDSDTIQAMKQGGKEAKREQVRDSLRNDQSNSQEKGIEID